jgi:acyl-CoA synthetase (AMP-forming)/AMP-acid ligase II
MYRSNFVKRTCDSQPVSRARVQPKLKIGLSSARLLYSDGSEWNPKMVEHLMPTIVSKPVSSLAVLIDGRDPWCTKCSDTHCGIHNAFLVLRLHRPFHDVPHVLL